VHRVLRKALNDAREARPRHLRRTLTRARQTRSRCTVQCAARVQITAPRWTDHCTVCESPAAASRSVCLDAHSYSERARGGSRVATSHLHRARGR
jgi:hypothetical protein